MRIVIEGSSTEIHEMLDRMGGAEIGVLDDMDARIMNLHQRVNNIKLPDPLKMWEGLERMHEDKKKPRKKSN
jgi:hypothetical protein